MKITKPFAIVAVFSALAFGGLGVAYAATDSQSGNYPPIVDKLAERFNLNKDEVKKVLQEEHQQRHEERKQKLEEKLNQAVKDGKLTEDQKTKLLAKLEEMHTKREEMKDKSHEEREVVREEFKKWAEENDINLEEIMPFGEGNRGHGHRGHRI